MGESTGPRTKAGKIRASRNACKPDADRFLIDALRAQRRYLTELKRFLILRKNIAQNGLLKKYLKNQRRALVRQGRTVTAYLSATLDYAQQSARSEWGDP